MVRIIQYKDNYLYEDCKDTIIMYSKKEEKELAFVDKKNKNLCLNCEYKDKFKKAYKAIKEDYKDYKHVDYLNFN